MHKANPDWGTHIPVLIKALEQTTGPVLEMGMGISSTPLLHALCADRFLLSMDNDPAFIEMFRKFRTKTHQIELVNWEDAPIIGKWGVVLVDHKPDSRRKEDIKKLANLAEFLVVHDTQDPQYGYEEIYPLFKYRYDFTIHKVHTTVLSTFNDYFIHNPLS